MGGEGSSVVQVVNVALAPFCSLSSPFFFPSPNNFFPLPRMLLLLLLSVDLASRETLAADVGGLHGLRGCAAGAAAASVAFIL